jgi:hypothetical protein
MGGPGAERELGDLKSSSSVGRSVGIGERTYIPVFVIFLLPFLFLGVIMASIFYISEEKQMLIQQSPVKRYPPTSYITLVRRPFSL